MLLDYAAVSDVGRVRKDNQDSGYAGPWLLAVCDGVGGAARGDIASATSVHVLRQLDERPGDDPLAQVAGSLHAAHDRIAELVDEDPALNGTSTTATLGLFDGRRLALGHIGDSRAYLLRDGELSQLTSDHTFVQSLIDEGRITEDDARTHPHRNLILKALDGIHEADPDLFVVELVPGDRLLFCSDGACGVLEPARIAELLSADTPVGCAERLVRSALDAGSSDNVTCIVADVHDPEAGLPADFDELAPVLVGSAAELRRRPSRGGRTSGLFRAPREADDTGELEPVPALPEGLPAGAYAIPDDPIEPFDPEQARYAPLAPRRFTWVGRVLVLLVVGGLLWVAGAAFYTWSQDRYYVGEQDGSVVIFRGVDADLPLLSLSEPYETTSVQVDRLPDYLVSDLADGMAAADLAEAHSIVENLAKKQGDGTGTTDGGTSTSSPSASPTGSAG